jgi:succinate-semialdehyde dehydrogenase/glutarate-semialdehyde dehydrogenase
MTTAQVNNTIEVINPATEAVLAEYPQMTEDDAIERVDAAHEGFQRWRFQSLNDRATAIARLGQHLRERQGELALLATRQMGKPIAEAETEVERCAWICDYYAEHGPRMLHDRPFLSDAQRSHLRLEPLGVILAIMPWNFPYWQVFRAAVPALMAGNTVVLKHASNVSGVGLAVEEAVRDAAGEEGLLVTLLLRGSNLGSVINHPAVEGVTVTGSDRTGRRVAERAGAELKKTVMELGGSDPFIVMPDADIDATVELAVEARMLNAGQSCTAAKRIIVLDPIAERFTDALRERLEQLRPGDPEDRATDLGPLARRDLLEQIEQQVADSVDAGARLAFGGQRLSREGYFHEPTLMTDVRPGMAVFDDETFGPVATTIRAEDIDEAIGLANRTRYGLSSSIHTSDTATAERMAGRLRAGSVFINGIAHYDPRIPMGGIKHSGYGRELGEPGLFEFLNTKTVWVAKPRRNGSGNP